MIDMTAILSFASEKFKRPIADEDELVEVGAEELKKRVETQGATLLSSVGTV